MTDDGGAAAVQARIEAYRADADIEGLLSTEAEQEAELLFRGGLDDPRKAALVAEFCWCRYEVTHSPDYLGPALALSDQLTATHPELRPGALGHALDAVDALVANPDALAATVSAFSDEAEAWAGLLYVMGVAWNEEPEPGPALLDRLIATMSLVSSLITDEHPGRRRAVVMLARHLTQRGEAMGRRADLDSAIATMDGVLAATSDDDEDLDFLRRVRFSALIAVSELDGSVAARVALAEEIMDAINAGDADLAAVGASIARLGPDGEVPSTEQALTLALLDVAVHPVGHPDRPGALFSLSAALSQRAGDRQSIVDSTSAITVAREMLALTAARPDAPVQHGLALTFLGRYLQQRYELTGDTTAIREAVELARTADQVLPDGHPIHTINLVNLGTFLFVTHEIDGARSELDEAADRLGQALADGASGPDEARALSMLSVVHYTRFRLDGPTADLDESVDLGRRAVAAIPDDDPSRPDWLGNLSNALRMRYALRGDVADIDEAVEAGRQAAERAPVEHADRARLRQVLGGALLERYERIGNPDDLDAALLAMRESAQRAAPGTVGSATAFSSLGNALSYRYERFGEFADLDQAIEVLRQAVDSAGNTALELPASLNNLAAALSMRASLTGSSTDLDDAVAVSRRTLEHAGPASLSVTGAYLNLGQALTQRFNIAGRRSDLDEAVALLRSAETTATSAERPSVFMNLASTLSARHQHFSDPADLDRAIDAVRSALEHATAGSVRRVRYQATLGSLLTTRFQERSSNPAASADENQPLDADLEAAIDVLREVERGTPAEVPERATWLYFLGTALVLWSARPGAAESDASDRAEAMLLAREAADVATAPAPIRMQAAQRWAVLAELDGDHAEALRGYEQAIDLLPLLTWRGLSRADQERRLVAGSGLSGDAAAVAIGAGRPELAVELLEQGRTVLWSQLLDSRGDLSALREVRPDLADRLAEVRAALDRDTNPAARITATLPPGVANHPQPADRPQTVERQQVDRTQLAREWDRLVGEARAQPGFADFLRPRRFTALSQAAAEGPVVIVNVSQIRCDALLVRPGQVEVVPLPGLAAEAVVDWLNQIYAAFAERPASVGEVIRNHQLVAGLLEWLWSAATGPVLDRLDDGEHVWWCPTGHLALLPLHAATEPVSGRSAIDHVVSSYTPTLRALITARNRPAPDGLDSADVLVVAVPHTPGAPDLDVQPEVDAIVGRLGDHCTVLVGPDATLDRVRSEVPRHRWLHFACHGWQNLNDPSHSALLLHDRPLTVLDLAGLGLADAELAFLSACQTAGGGAVLSDEAIHLAAALQINGFRQIVATLWPLYDAVAPEVTDQVYAELAASGPADTGRALHAAVGALRSGRGQGRPAVWAPYIHIGP